MNQTLSPAVSIIICSRNRVNDLRETLNALSKLTVPADITCELIVVDNASTDDTASVARSFKPANMSLRYLFEPRQGQNYGYNTAVGSATGDVLLFTDDDVRPEGNWIEGMCRPILNGEYDVVAGGVRIAPHLLRPWMELPHRTWLASTEWLAQDGNEGMVGANMAISKRVFERVPEFDPELGPGTLGFGGETLFYLQLKEAGYRRLAAFDVAVEHHFEESRLTRDGLLARLAMAGKMFAYIDYHWEHRVVRYPHLRLIKARLRLALLRWHKRQEIKAHEGMPVWEMIAISGLYFYKQYLTERHRPFNYEWHGLVKRNHQRSAADSMLAQPVDCIP